MKSGKSRNKALSKVKRRDHHSDKDNIDINLYRVVADFRHVNLTIYNAGYADYVMGAPQEIVFRMGGHTHFISLDLKSAGTATIFKSRLLFISFAVWKGCEGFFYLKRTGLDL